MIHRRFTIVAIAAVTALGGGLAASAGAKGGHKTDCNKSYTGMTFHGGVTIHAGDNCTLKDDTIDGGLTITGGTYRVDNTTMHGPWRITGGTARGFGDECGNNVDGGIRVMHTNHGRFIFGETDRHCAGGRVNGGVKFLDNTNIGILEVDSYRINGGIRDTGNEGIWNEVENDNVHGHSVCANNNAVHGGSTAINDEGGPNSYKGKNVGCPA